MKASGIVDMASDVVKSAVSRQDEITVVEAGNMWNKLLARYDSIENILVLMNYVKDEDLRKETQIVLKKIRQQSEQLAKLMAEYSVSTIPRPASEIKISVGEPSFTDRYIFASIFQNIKWLLPVHIVSFIQSTSPKVRKMFKGFLLEEMDMYDRLRDFGLKKNWLQSYPEYEGGENKSQEKPSIMEVAQMWSKLAARYKTMEFTNHMVNLARDPDLTAAIVMGQDTLKEQITELEKMLQKYVSPLPARPPEAEKATRPVDAIPDRYIFRQIFRGIQSFLPLHMVAYQESNTPAVRKEFKKLLVEEINIYDKFVSYGLLKGWVFKPPSFKG